MKQSLLEISAKYDLDSFREEIHSVETELELNIGFLGEYNAGKSTLINALLGDKFLPAMENPTTGNVIEIHPKSGLSEARRLERYHDRVVEISSIEFSEIATGKTEGTGFLEVPEHDLFKEGFCFVDTPGLSSLNETHTDITYGYLPRLDGAVICIDGNQGGMSRSVESFLKRPEIQPLLDRFVIALTHHDQLTEKKAHKARGNVIEAMRRLNKSSSVPVEERVVLVSGGRALEGEENSNLDTFKTTFQNIFYERERTLKKRRKNLVLNELGLELSDSLKDLKQNLEMSDSDLEKKEQAIESDIRAIENRIREAEETFERFGRSLQDELVQVMDRHKSTIAAADEDNLDACCEALTRDATNTVDAWVERLLGDLQTPDISRSTQQIKVSVRRILQGVDLGTTMVTGLLAAAVTAGSSFAANAAQAGAGSAAKEAARQGTKSTVNEAIKAGAKTGAKKVLALKALKQISDVVEKVNPVNYLGKLLADKMKKSKVEPMLDRIAHTVAADVKQYVELRYEDRVMAPINRKLENQKVNLREARKERRCRVDEIRERKRQIDDDIARLDRQIDSVEPELQMEVR